MDRKVSPEVMDDFFIANAKLLFDKAESISTEELFGVLKKERRLTHYATGAVGWISDPKARPTAKTVNTLDHQFSEEDLLCYENIFTGLRIAKGGLEKMELVGGEGKNRFIIRCVFPLKLAEMMLGYSKIMRPAAPGEVEEARKVFYQIMAPGYEIEVAQAIKAGVNLMQGGNYIGMPKKSGFTLWLDYVNEVLGGFGMHAGYKKVTVPMPNGSVKNYVIIIIGESGHGKSTLSFSNYGIDNMETLFGGDDMVALIPDGNSGFRVVGFETLGLYLKAVGISPTNEPFTYEGAMGSDVILENVPIDSHGMPRFEKESKSILGTDNHRAIVFLRYFTRGPAPALDVELDSNTQLVIMLLNRALEYPSIVRYETPEHATAMFGALPSETTSAHKPDAKGGDIELKCGADDFTPGPKRKKLQRLCGTLKNLNGKVTVLAVNTGKYNLGETEHSIKLVLLETAEWVNLKPFPGRRFLKDLKMGFDDHFLSRFGDLCVRQKARLREIGAPKEVIEAL